MTPSETYWNDEPCEARIVRVIVADTQSFPNYWAQPYVGQEREAVEVTYAGRTFYLDNEAHTPQGAELEALDRFGIDKQPSPAGEGWRKVTEHRGSPRAPHRSLDVERVLEPSLRPNDSPPGAAMTEQRADDLTPGTRKGIASARRRAERRAQRSKRRQRWSCFWSWPIGHRYETPDGRGPAEVFATSSSGARPQLRCVGCGCRFGLFEGSDYGPERRESRDDPPEPPPRTGRPSAF